MGSAASVFVCGHWDFGVTFRPVDIIFASRRCTGVSGVLSST